MKKERAAALVMSGITVVFVIAVIANIIAGFFEVSLPDESLVIPTALYGIISIPYVIFMIYRESKN